jgi:xylulokinase
MARAVLEGCALAMRDVLGRLHSMGVPIESILLLGGGARSRLWAQIRADVSGIPVTVPARLDTSPIGAAMLAAVAAKIQPDLESCANLIDSDQAAGTGKTTLDPDPVNSGVYEGVYRAYGRLFDSLRPMFTPVN